MRVTHISAATYSALTDDLTAAKTIMLNGSWPISIGHHPNFPGAQIMIGHVQDRFIILTLDDVPEQTPDEVERMLRMNPEALQ